MIDAFDDFEAVATRMAPPDPEILKAIGLNHGLASAIADLVDNALDAKSGRVLVRFVLRDGLISQLMVVDDGNGMNGEEIDAAMRLGKQKSDSGSALGHFGMGLKAASFSQANLLTVLSRRHGAGAVGRRMAREPKSGGFDVEELESTQVAVALDTKWTDFTTDRGTVVLWDDIRTFPKARDRAVTNEFVEKRLAELRSHLGLTFHRLLEQSRFKLEIDVVDIDTGEAGFSFEIEPIDPFAYARSGVRGYPKVLTARHGSEFLPMVCHIWPAGSDSHCFRLAGAPIDRFQGFYMYRNDRLLSAGGWAGVTSESKQRRLARVAIDIEDHLDVMAMSVEKAGVRMSADLVNAIEVAMSDDRTTFAGFLDDAEVSFRESNKRVAQRSPRLTPGQGIPPRIKRAIANEVDFLEEEEPMRIRWDRFADDSFVFVDRKEQTLWLNSAYRDAVLKGAHGGVNDAPLLKALLYLLYEDIFRGTAYGAKDKDNVSLWQGVLDAAAMDELAGHGE